MKIKEIAEKLEKKGWVETRKITKKILKMTTSCTLQHTGWCCNSCFYNINEKVTQKQWATVLWLRGDYQEGELPGLPQKDEDRYLELARLYKIITKTCQHLKGTIYTTVSVGKWVQVK